MDNDAAFVMALEREIDALRQRAAKSTLAPGKDAPLAFTPKECRVLRQAASRLGCVSVEALLIEGLLTIMGGER